MRAAVSMRRFSSWRRAYMLAYRSLLSSSNYNSFQRSFLSAVWETCTEYHCTPTKVFFKVFTVVETSSDCCNLAQGPINWLAQFTEPNLEWKSALASASWWGPPGRVSVIVWNPWVMSPTPTLPWSNVEQRLHSASSTRTPSSSGCSCWRSTTWDPWTWKRRTRGNGRPNAGPASGGDGRTWTSTWGKNRDKIIRLNPKITDGRGKLEKVWWHWPVLGEVEP